MLEVKECLELKKITQLLKEAGFCEVRYYIKKIRSQYYNIRNQRLDSQIYGDQREYLVEAQKDGWRSCTSFSRTSDYPSVVAKMKEAASNSTERWRSRQLYENSGNYEEIWEDSDEIKHKLCEAEQKAFTVKETAVVIECSYKKVQEQIYLVDDNHVLFDQTGYCCGSVRTAARSKESTETASCCVYGSDIFALNFNEVVFETAVRSAKALGGQPVVSGDYSCILDRQVAAEIIEAFLPIFYADNIQNKLSVLTGREGSKIGAAGLWLKEQPDYPKGRCRRKFDDEGIMVREKTLISDGLLTAKLYNCASAEKEGCESSGNGFKSSLSDDIGTAVTNIVLKGDDKIIMLQDQLMKELEAGLLVTEVDGVFAGVNHQTGTFSLIAKGMEVDHGKVKRPFCGVTIAGSILELLMNVVKIADVTGVTQPYNQSVAAPAILVKRLTVSGW